MALFIIRKARERGVKLKRFFPAVLIAVLVFGACHQPAEPTSDENTGDKTIGYAIFKNENNAKVKVYYTQGDFVVEVPALNTSGKIEQLAGGVASFVVSYSLEFMGIPIEYKPRGVKWQLNQRIDDDKTKTFIIPKLEETIPVAEAERNQYKLSENIYLMIKNNSSNGILLKKGNTNSKPETIKSSDGVPTEAKISTFNPQELAIYKITPEERIREANFFLKCESRQA
jgi:hypothetical protein